MIGRQRATYCSSAPSRRRTAGSRRRSTCRQSRRREDAACSRSTCRPGTPRRLLGQPGDPNARRHAASSRRRRRAGRSRSRRRASSSSCATRCAGITSACTATSARPRRTWRSMASQGALFLDNVSQATWTKVSTPSIMTSLYPTSHARQGFPDRLSPAATTIAEVFREAGYATVAFSSVAFTGKFTNLHQGFEELHESSSVEDPPLSAPRRRACMSTAPPTGSSAIRTRRSSCTCMCSIRTTRSSRGLLTPRLWADPARREEHEKERETSRKFIEDQVMKQFAACRTAEELEEGRHRRRQIGELRRGLVRRLDSRHGRRSRPAGRAAARAGA